MFRLLYHCVLSIHARACVGLKLLQTLYRRQMLNSQLPLIPSGCMTKLKRWCLTSLLTRLLALTTAWTVTRLRHTTRYWWRHQHSISVRPACPALCSDRGLFLCDRGLCNACCEMSGCIREFPDLCNLDAKSTTTTSSSLPALESATQIRADLVEALDRAFYVNEAAEFQQKPCICDFPPQQTMGPSEGWDPHAVIRQCAVLRASVRVWLTEMLLTLRPLSSVAPSP